MTAGSNRTRLIAYGVTALWSVLVLLAGVQLDDTWKQVASVIPVVVVAAVASFDNYLWRQWPFRKFAKQPVLIGTWRGTLVSMRDSEDGQEVAHDAIPIFLVIGQSYLRLSVSLHSAESRSRSIVAVIQRNDDREYTAYYHYANVPGLEARRRTSQRHAGGATITVTTLQPSSLTGEYWTDRRTRGTYAASRATRERYGSWDEAVAVLGSEAS